MGIIAIIDLTSCEHYGVEKNMPSGAVLDALQRKK